MDYRTYLRQRIERQEAEVARLRKELEELESGMIKSAIKDFFLEVKTQFLEGIRN